jgi:hypothetical protein
VLEQCTTCLEALNSLGIVEDNKTESRSMCKSDSLTGSDNIPTRGFGGGSRESRNKD